MFAKIFAHEVRNSWRVPVFMSVVALALSILVLLETALTESAGFQRSAPLLLRALLGIFSFLYVLFMMAANLIVALHMPARFLRESYGDAGYLFHSMPLKKSAFLGAHVLCGGLWILLYGVVDFVCTMIVSARVNLFGILWSDMGALWRELWALSSVVRTQYILLILAIVIGILLTPFAFINLCCCSVTLGQMFKKHKTFGAFVWTFVLGMAVATVDLTFFVSAVLSVDYGLYGYLAETAVTVINRIVILFWMMVVLLLLQSILFWWISVRRMNRKLNLE